MDGTQDKMQMLVDGLCSLDYDSAVTVVTSVLQARPELATPAVTFAVPDLTYPPSRALIERRAEGVIKSFNTEKGFGFIDCQELKDTFGHDVFFHHSQLAGYGPGAPVNFAVMLNKENKPQAYDLQQAGKGGSKGMPGKGAMMKGGWGGDKGGGGGGWGAGGDDGWMQKGAMMMMMKGKGMVPPWMMKGKDKGMGKGGKDGFGKGKKGKGEETPLGNFSGVVKSYNEKNGYGFIDCAEVKQEHGADVFLHSSDKGSFNVGDHVAFSCFVNTMGKPQARELQGCLGDASGFADGGASKRQRTDVAWG